MGLRREEGDGSKHGGIRAPTARKSEPAGSLYSARAAGILAVGVGIGVAGCPSLHLPGRESERKENQVIARRAITLTFHSNRPLS
jgi:hypothetical protein